MGIQIPAWLEALGTQKFFEVCSVHESAKKNEKNICCLDCCTSICPHCVPSHRFHHLVQVRRYVYHDVVRLEDLNKLIDCSNVQAYTINSSKVVFIKKRPQSRQFKGLGNICSSCDRTLQEPYIHCSLECKVNYLLKHKKDLSAYLRVTCETLRMDVDYDEANETTRSTIVEGEDDPMGSSSSSENLSPAGVKFVRKKRSSLFVCGRSASNTPSNEDMENMSMMSRRKGTPHRSPMC